MDPGIVVLIALVGLVLIWAFFRAFSNSRHAPSAKVRGNIVRSGLAYLYDFGSADHVHDEPPRPPRSG